MMVRVAGAHLLVRLLWIFALTVLPSQILWLRFADVLPFFPILHAELLLAAAALALWPRAGLLLAAAVVVLVIANAVATLFHFGSFIEMLEQPLSESLDLLSLVREYVEFVFLGLATVALLALASRQVGRKDAAVAIALLLLAGGLDRTEGIIAAKNSRFGQVNLLGSPMMRLVRDRYIHPPLQLQRLTDREVLRDDTLNWVRLHPGRSVVFVIAESLGTPADPVVRMWLDEQLEASSDYEKRSGSTPFSGTTTYGELRQLCQLKGSYLLLDENAARGCLPKRLGELGLRSVGLHGFSSYMFNRKNWWTDIGLQRGLFLEELGTTFKRRCGGHFQGICDADLIRAGMQELDKAPTFAYLLTLNTHLPLPEVPGLQLPRELCERRSLPPRICQMLAMQGQMLRTLSEQVLSRKDRPLLIVVGDHAPPFVEAENRVAFKVGVVPYWLLLPLD